MLLDGRKVAGILAEARPQEGWAVLGIGINVALRPDDFPPELARPRGHAGPRPGGRPEPCSPPSSPRWSAASRSPPTRLLDAWRERDALAGRVVTWDGGRGTADGIDEDGRLRVARDGGATTTLDAGEVHLGAPL